jgi:hypothetical protein
MFRNSTRIGSPGMKMARLREMLGRMRANAGCGMRAARYAGSVMLISVSQFSLGVEAYHSPNSRLSVMLTRTNLAIE